MNEIFDALAKRWNSSVVARSKVGEFSGGALSPKYLANQDSLGAGPKGRFFIGRQIVYPVTELVIWMKARARNV